MEKITLLRVNTGYTDLCIFRKQEYKITKDLLCKSRSYSRMLSKQHVLLFEAAH